MSQLELELQAEVDKYVTCLLHDVDSSEALRERLFRACAYEDDLDGDERERYQVANDNAHRYAAWLEETFVARFEQGRAFVFGRMHVGDRLPSFRCGRRSSAAGRSGPRRRSAVPGYAHSMSGLSPITARQSGR